MEIFIFTIQMLGFMGVVFLAGLGFLMFYASDPRENSDNPGSNHTSSE